MILDFVCLLLTFTTQKANTWSPWRLYYIFFTLTVALALTKSVKVINRNIYFGRKTNKMCYTERTFYNYKRSKRPNMSNFDFSFQCNRCIWTKNQGLDLFIKEITAHFLLNGKMTVNLRVMQTFELLLYHIWQHLLFRIILKIRLRSMQNKKKWPAKQ